MGNSSMHNNSHSHGRAAGSMGGRGRRPRVPGGFPFQRRVALTELHGAQLTELAARDDLSVGAYLGRLVQRHLDSSADPLPPSAHDLITVLTTLSDELREALVEARTEGGLLNQIARHLNIHHAGQDGLDGVPEGVAGVLERALSRHEETTTTIDALLWRADRLITFAAEVLGRRSSVRDGAAVR